VAPRYVVGCEVTYETNMGDLRTVKVTAVHDDIKNGEPGFDGTVLAGYEANVAVWGYDRQIVSVRQEGGVPC